MASGLKLDHRSECTYTVCARLIRLDSIFFDFGYCLHGCVVELMRRTKYEHLTSTHTAQVLYEAAGIGIESTHWQSLGSVSTPSLTPSMVSHCRSTSSWIAAQVASEMYLDDVLGSSSCPTWIPNAWRAAM